MSRLSREFPDSWEERLDSMFETADTHRKQQREESTMTTTDTDTAAAREFFEARYAADPLHDWCTADEVSLAKVIAQARRDGAACSQDLISELACALLDSLQREEQATAEAERDMKNMAKGHLDSEVEYRATIRGLIQRLAAAEAKAGWRPMERHMSNVQLALVALGLLTLVNYALVAVILVSTSP